MERLWEFHARPDVIQLLTPPGMPVRVVRQTGGLETGSEKEFVLGIWPLRMRWLARHVEFEAGRMFADRQIRGPFRQWLHRHVMSAEGTGSRLTDTVTYEFAGGAWTEPVVRWQLRRLFEHRHRVTGENVGAGSGSRL